MMGDGLAYAADEGLRDIRPVIDSTSFSYWIWLGVFVAVIFLGLIWWFYYRKKQEKLPEPDPVAELLDQLSLLKEAPKNKQSYQQLSVVLRGFIEEWSGVNALEMTIPEFVSYLKKESRLNQEDRQDLIELSLRIEEVSFAPRLNDSERHVENDVGRVVDFIKKQQGVV